MAQPDTVLYPVTASGNIKYVNDKGHVVPINDSIISGDNFAHGFAIVTNFNRKRGAIDATGKLAVPFGPTELYYYPEKKWWVAQYYPDSLRIYTLDGGQNIYKGPGKFVMFYPDIDRMMVNSVPNTAKIPARSVLMDMSGRKIAEQQGMGTVQFAAIEEHRPDRAFYHNRHCLRLIVGKKYALTDIDGKVLFDSTNSGEFIQGRLRLSGTKGEEIIDTLLRAVIPFSAGYSELTTMEYTPYYFARKGSLCGIIDSAQHVIFPFTLSGQLWGHDTRLFETVDNKKQLPYTLYSYAGEQLVASKNAIQLQPMWPGATPNNFPLIVERDETTYQLWKDHFIGKSYRRINGFSKDGWAIFATSDHRTGLLDSTGREVFVTDYYELAYPVEGILAAGTLVACPECNSYPCAATFSTEKETKVRQFFFLDMLGHRLSKQGYDFIFPYQHGQAKVSRNCKDMIIGRDGTAIGAGLVYVSAKASGVYIVQDTGKQRALADSNGNVISPWVTGFQMNEGNTLAFNFVSADNSGTSAIGTLQLPAFINGRIRFEEHGAYGLMDSTGKVVLPAVYSNVGVSGNYIFVAQQHDGATYTGLLNAGGKELVSPIYNSIKALGNDKFLLQKEYHGEYSVYNAGK